MEVNNYKIKIPSNIQTLKENIWLNKNGQLNKKSNEIVAEFYTHKNGWSFSLDGLLQLFYDSLGQMQITGLKMDLFYEIFLSYTRHKTPLNREKCLKAIKDMRENVIFKNSTEFLNLVGVERWIETKVGKGIQKEWKSPKLLLKEITKVWTTLDWKTKNKFVNTLFSKIEED